MADDQLNRKLRKLRRDPRAVAAFSARSHLRAQLVITRAWTRLLASRAGIRFVAGAGFPPLICFHGDEDTVVSLETNHRLFRRRPDSEVRIVAGGRHDLPWEPQTGGMVEDLVSWIRQQSGAA